MYTTKAFLDTTWRGQENASPQAPQKVPRLNPRICGYVATRGKREFAYVTLICRVYLAYAGGISWVFKRENPRQKRGEARREAGVMESQLGGEKGPGAAGAEPPATGTDRTRLLPAPPEEPPCPHLHSSPDGGFGPLISRT